MAEGSKRRVDGKKLFTSFCLVMYCFLCLSTSLKIKALKCLIPVRMSLSDLMFSAFYQSKVKCFGVVLFKGACVCNVLYHHTKVFNEN